MEAIAEFAYYGTNYQDDLRTLEWNFGQTHAVVRANLLKLSNYPALKMHNMDNIFSFSAQNLVLVGLFRSRHYGQDLTSATLVGQAAQKLAPNLKEPWVVYRVENKWSRSSLLKFNDNLTNKIRSISLTPITKSSLGTGQNSILNQFVYRKTKSAIPISQNGLVGTIQYLYHICPT